MAACGGSAGASAPPSSAGAVAISAAATAGPPAAPAAGPAPVFARGQVRFRTAAGTVTMPVEVADDEAKREYGLMNRRSLPADAGMIFVFQPAADSAQVGFWMKDTLLPLSIAFVDADLTIESVQDMQPLTEDVHRAPRPFIYAIEVNQGYFPRRHIAIGDTVVFSR
ncbi:MAG: DUF192 domain-containing protein [Chloroflexota bacterium]|nr:DUF192 domain-containing protein [Chloroflexota bacterium]